MNKKILSFCFVLLSLCAVISACERQSGSGVVASVNGEPITMRELQARHDLDHMIWSVNSVPPVEELQSQYGDSLITLVINHLVMQELENHDLAVTSEEMDLAEREIKAGYADGEFEATLEDDAIDMEMWRNFLRQRLSVQKFMQSVLRPGIRVNPEESAAYYSEHIEQFSMPVRFYFLVLESYSESVLKEILERQAHESGNIAQMVAGRNDVRMREVRMREDRLAPDWQKILVRLKPGQASKIFESEGSFNSVILINVQEPTELTLMQAYPLIERELVERKLELAFDSWVEKSISESSIQMAAHLAEVWVDYRLNHSNSTYPEDMPWLHVDEGYDPNADPFEDEEAKELFKQESDP